MESVSRPLRWLHGEVKTPPMGLSARREMGLLLRRVQERENLSLPHSRPMPVMGSRCYEMRVNDDNKTWRLVYRIDGDAVVILEVFEKKTSQTPKHVIEKCKQRLKQYGLR